ncbi:MAG TPA: DoxX family membrane protein [Symbiobacteriaceae bacterium]
MLEYFKGAKGSWMWVIIRLWLGYNWVQAGWHKLSGATPFDASGFIKGGIAGSVPAKPGAKPTIQPWWGNFLKNFALPNTGLFNFLVMYGEILVGLALLVGFATIFAASMGFLMNFAFVMSGSISTSPVYMILQFVLVLGGAYAGYIGVDYWFRPMYRNFVAGLFGGEKTVKSAA